jgi:predicted metal-dependent phosphoesterase TrpH
MIDLHTHTDQSDGTTPPHQLVRAAAAMSLEALAITDHDTLAGYDLAAPAAREAGLELICGIELSTRLEQKNGEPRSPSIHLLGYFPDREPRPEFRDWLLQQQQSRRARNVALIAKLQSLGVEIVLEEVQALGRNLTGRPHFARILVSKGYVRTTQEAFDVYLADDAQAAVEREEPSLLAGIRRVAAAGGLAVLAHPVRLAQRELGQLEAFVAELVEAGLNGIEVFHSEHSAADTDRFLAVARRFALIVTGGSDFHGDNKPGIHLATGKGGNLCLPYRLAEEMRTPVERPARI